MTAEKHLPDPFYLEGDKRISIRSHILREVIVNSLIHREYLSHFPSKFVIERDKLFFENANKPHGFGIINLTNFTPFPKNPIISSFFRQIQYSEELGSGFKKVAKYGKTYFGIEPIIIEKDIFRFEAKFGNKISEIILGSSLSPTKIYRENNSEDATAQVTAQVTAQAEVLMLEFCKTPRTRDEIQSFLGLKHREHFRKDILNPLIKKGELKLTIPDKPKSPNQRYIVVKD